MHKIVVDAVNAYFEEKSSRGEDKSEARIPDEYSVSKLSDSIRRLELMLSLNNIKPTSQADRETASSILEINKELIDILNVIRGPLKSEIDKLVLFAEEEHTLHEESCAELIATKNQWKAELTRLKESVGLAHGTQSRGPEEVLLKKLLAAEAETKQLKEIIRTMRVGS
jgi:hypothetical protein